MKAPSHSPRSASSLHLMLRHGRLVRLEPFVHLPPQLPLVLVVLPPLRRPRRAREHGRRQAAVELHPLVRVGVDLSVQLLELSVTLEKGRATDTCPTLLCFLTSLSTPVGGCERSERSYPCRRRGCGRTSSREASRCSVTRSSQTRQPCAKWRSEVKQTVVSPNVLLPDHITFPKVAIPFLTSLQFPSR